MNKKVLLYPGAFNPPHLGHESVIETALKQVQFDEVWVMPSGNRPDKTISTSYTDRRVLGQLFVDSVQSKVSVPIKLISAEIEEGNSKLAHELINEIQSQPGLVVTQLIGVDGLEFLARKYGADLDSERYLVVQRKGYQLDATVNPDKIVFLISSTQVRELAKRGDTTYKELVSVAIGDYVEQHQLYI
jgi:nicotinate-nucleotide adenylyltransferase